MSRRDRVSLVLLLLFRRPDIRTGIKHPGRQLPGTSDEKDCVTDRSTGAESTIPRKVQSRRTETGKEVRTF